MNEALAIKTPDWQAILKSDLFTFVCGSDESNTQTFQVHSYLVAEASPALNALVNNGMTETISRSVKLPEVEPETFVLFSQWLYTGLYRLPSTGSESAISTANQPTQSSTKSNPSRSPASFCIRCGSKKPTNGPPQKFCDQSCARLWAYHESQFGPIESYCSACGRGIFRISNIDCFECNDCRHRSLEGAQPLQIVDEDSPTKKVLTLKHDVAGVPHAKFAAKLNNEIPALAISNDICGHAKLYCFAMMYMVDKLKDICLHLLQRDLNAYTIGAATIGAVLDLVRYTYNNTSTASEAGDGRHSGAQLRTLVLEFVLLNKEILGKSAEFEELLFEGGDFVVDFFKGRLANTP